MNSVLDIQTLQRIQEPRLMVRWDQNHTLAGDERMAQHVHLVLLSHWCQGFQLFSRSWSYKIGLPSVKKIKYECQVI